VTEEPLVERTPVFDREWYSAQLPHRTFERDLPARRHYARNANRQRSPHPLFEPLFLYPNGSWERSGPDPLTVALAADGQPGRSPHPLVDLRRIEGSYADWIAGLSDDTVLPAPPGVRDIRYADLRAHLLGDRTTPALEPDDRRVTLVVPLRAEHVRETADFVRITCAHHPGVDIEVLLCAAGGTALQRLGSAIAFALTDGKVTARTLDLPSDLGWTAAARAGVDAATGGVTVLVRPGLRGATWPWLAELAAGARSAEIAVPLLLDTDFVVAAAGASYTGAVPEPLLAGFTIGDAERLDEVPGPWPGLTAARTDLLREVGLRDDAGDSWAEVDLARRAGRTLLVAESRVPVGKAFCDSRPADQDLALAVAWREPPPGTIEAWASAGLASDGTRLAGGPLRWVIDIAAPGGPLGQRWGDHFFAISLRQALERQGQLATIDSRSSRGRATRAVEDVVVVLRGLDRVERGSEAYRILWVISHPELVEPDEVHSSDASYAASASWAERRNAEWGTSIRPLLQCTDQERFRPGVSIRTSSLGPARPAEGAVLFVGNARKTASRPVVDLALAHAEDFVLYGAGWTGPAAEHVAATSVPNTELGALYAAARIVLNDHWADMRAEGFVSNRLFDAVACGARVLSDHIDGVEELFGGAVQTFRDEADFVRLVHQTYDDPDSDDSFPGVATRLEIADRIRHDHTFDARASELIATVLRHPPFTTSSVGFIRDS
jgi:hypothetical protein